MEPDRWYGCYGAPRDGLFTRASNRHPAKMAVGLAARILGHGEQRGYWRKGDTLLDPMAGIGTTIVLAAALGYEAVGVELEPHFVELASGNIAQASRKFDPRGGCRILQGDARDLSGVLAEAVLTSPPYPSAFRAVVTSPPYADRGVVAGAGMTARILREAKDHGIDAAVKLYRETVIDRQKAHGRWSDDNIRSHIEAALATRESGYSAIVTSPPYGDASMPGMVSARIRQLARAGKWDEAVAELREIDRKDVRVGNRRAGHTDAYLRQAIEHALERDGDNYGARAPDAVVSSPPHSQAQPGAGIATRGYGDGSDKVGDRTYQPRTHGQTTGQIGNLRDPNGDIDAVLSSPPWEDQARGGQQGWSNPAKAARIAADRYLMGERRGHGARAEAIEAQMHRDNEKVYGHSAGQIGNERGETYCAAMLRVYQQMHAVLKPGAVVCLVTKNPVKRGKIRRLDEDTIRLMDAAGFDLIEHIHAMLAKDVGSQFRLDGGETRIRVERKSFFKRLFERTHPELRVDHESVLFFRRAERNPSLEKAQKKTHHLGA